MSNLYSYLANSLRDAQNWFHEIEDKDPPLIRRPFWVAMVVLAARSTYAQVQNEDHLAAIGSIATAALSVYALSRANHHFIAERRALQQQQFHQLREELEVETMRTRRERLVLARIAALEREERGSLFRGWMKFPQMLGG